MSFTGKIALVTGAGAGIGAATARTLAALGATVIVADIDGLRADAVAGTLGGRGSGISMDVSDWSGVEQAFASVEASYGALHVLINNAGIAALGLTPDLAVESWRRTISVTLDGVFHCCKAAIPLMRPSGGVIVNVASISGLVGDYGLSAYNAAKGAVVNYTRTLAIDHIREGIRVNSVCPGMVETPGSEMLRASPELWQRIMAAYPRGKAASVDEIASVIAFLASDASTALVGSNVVADGGLTAWSGMPKLT